MPGDNLTVEEALELDDTNPDDSRYYAVMVAGGWAALTCAFAVALAVIGLPARSLLGDRTGNIVATTCVVGAFFCLAGGVSVLGRMLWYVPQARRRLREHGADSDAFRKSMRRSLPGNGSLIFQAAVAILVLLLAV